MRLIDRRRRADADSVAEGRGEAGEDALRGWLAPWWRGVAWRRVGEELRDFAWLYLERFGRDACLRNAATLAYTTLLALVPLVTIAASVIAAFPVFAGAAEELREWMVANFVPATGAVVEEHLESFVAGATQLTIVGVVGLVVTALLLMAAIEQAMNDIWRVRRPRPALQRFMVYWTVLTVGPLLMALSVAATSYVVSVARIEDLELGGLQGALVSTTPFLSAWVAFAFLYAVVPNERVPLRHAVAGGLLAAALFELAKRAFAWYVAIVPTYEAVYGALAALPLFLIWLYICWVLVLMGAEFTRSLAAHQEERRGPLGTRRNALMLTVRLLAHLYAAQRRGQGLTTSQLAHLEAEAGYRAVAERLQALATARVIERSASAEWLLARDLSRYTLRDLFYSEPFAVPELGRLEGGERPCDRRLREALAPVQAGLAAGMAVPLAELLEDETEAREAAEGAAPGEEVKP